MTSPDPNRQKLTQLRKLLIQHFSLDELRVLCFDLGLEYEDLPGNTKTTKMHSLVEYFQRRGRLSQLLAEAAEHRPNVIWPLQEVNETLASKRGIASSMALESYICEKHEKTGLEMILIPAGVFQYGEKKELKFLPDFWIAKTPVTNIHYDKFVKETGHKAPVTPQ